MQNPTTHHKGKQEDRQAGRQEGRPAERQAGRQGRQNLGKADTPSNTGKQEGRQWETKGETKPREGGRTIQHRTLQAHMWGNNGRQGETRPWEVGHTVQHRHTCEETMGDKGRQDVEKADTPSNKGKQEGRWERRGNKTSGRRTHHPTQADKRRQDRGKADTPRLRHHPRQAHMCGDNGRQNGRQDVEKTHHPTQAQVWADNGRQWAQWERRGDKTSRRRTHHPTKGNKKGDGREGETRPREGGHTIQTQADKRRQDCGKADTPRLRHHPRQAHMCGDNGRQNGKTRRRKDAPSNTGTSVGRQWETMGSMGEKGRQDLHRHTCGETMGENGEQWGTRGDQGDKTSKRRAHTSTRKGNKKGGGDNGRRQGEIRPWEGGHAIQHKRILWGDNGDKGRQGETRGDKTSRRRKRHQADKPSQAHMWGVTMGDKKGRQDVVKADAPANTGTRARRQWETMGDNWFNGRQG